MGQEDKNYDHTYLEKRKNVVSPLKKIIRIVAWLPAVLMAVVIFSFSSQDGNQSSGISEKIAKVLVNMACSAKMITIDQSEKAQLIEDMQYPIRKFAHMTEYMILTLFIGVGLYAWDLRNKKLVLLQFLLAFLFACSDEVHQLFIPGRSGIFQDVLIDSIGICAAVFISYTITRRWLNIRVDRVM